MADKKQPHINEQFHTWLGLWKWRHACAASKHNAILLLGTYNKKMLQHVTCCLHTCPVTLLSEICRNRRFPMGLGHLGGWGRRPQSVYGLLEWCRYNFAAGSFHTKKLCSRVFFAEVEIYWKITKSRFVPPFGGVRGNVHGSFMAHWKVCGRLPISASWTFFAISHGWGAMSKYWSKLCCLKGGGSLWSQISGGKGVVHQRILAPEN